MNLYTFYSPSHKHIYQEYFLKSFNKYLSNDFNLVVKTDDQKTSDGSFSDPKVSAVWGDKIHLLKNAIIENDGKWFLYSDCDIQFFGNIKEDIESHMTNGLDIICQEDCNTICAGFMAIKASKKMLDFMKLIEMYHHNSNDQIVMNQFRNLVRYKLLPKDRYFTIGNYNGGRVWNPGENVPSTENIIMHHANFTIGVENKISMMEEVRNLKNKIE